MDIMGEFEGLSSPHSDRLSKTSAEQSILRNIYELERELRENEDIERDKSLQEQISLLKEQLNTLQGPSRKELAEENNSLKNEVSELRKKTREFAEKCETLTQGQSTIITSRVQNENRLYRLLLKKYARLINESEKKTVGEVKAQVTKDDLSLHSLVEDLKPKEYSYEKNYIQAASNILRYITAEIDFVSSNTGVNFWLSPKEILEEKVADDEDLAVFYCSALYSLGDDNAEVLVVELDSLQSHAVVSTHYKGTFYLIDPSQKTLFDAFCGTKHDALSKYAFRGAKVRRLLYRFNHSNYEQFL